MARQTAPTRQHRSGCDSFSRSNSLSSNSSSEPTVHPRQDAPSGKTSTTRSSDDLAADDSVWVKLHSQPNTFAVQILAREWVSHGPKYEEISRVLRKILTFSESDRRRQSSSVKEVMAVLWQRTKASDRKSIWAEQVDPHQASMIASKWVSDTKRQTQKKGSLMDKIHEVSGWEDTDLLKDLGIKAWKELPSEKTLAIILKLAKMPGATRKNVSEALRKACHGGLVHITPELAELAETFWNARDETTGQCTNDTATRTQNAAGKGSVGSVPQNSDARDFGESDVMELDATEPIYARQGKTDHRGAPFASIAELDDLGPTEFRKSSRMVRQSLLDYLRETRITARLREAQVCAQAKLDRQKLQGAMVDPQVRQDVKDTRSFLMKMQQVEEHMKSLTF